MCERLFSLDGHTGPILSIGTDQSDSNIICSGSEDATVRLWDLRCKKSTNAIVCFDKKEVTSVIFGSKKGQREIFATAYNKLYKFDARNLSNAVLIHEYKKSVSITDDDELNEVSLNHDQTLISTSDDSGAVTILTTDDFVTLTQFPAQDDLCTSAKFVPKTPSELMSCGTDCRWRYWRVSRTQQARAAAAKGESATSVCAVAQLREWHASEATATAAAQVINPPYAHHVAFDASGRSAAVALGDGRVAVCRDIARPQLESFSAHASATSAVCFVEKNCKPLIASVGDDGWMYLHQRQARASKSKSRFAGGVTANWKQCAAVQVGAKLNVVATTSWILFVGDTNACVNVYSVKAG